MKRYVALLYAAGIVVGAFAAGWVAAQGADDVLASLSQESRRNANSPRADEYRGLQSNLSHYHARVWAELNASQALFARTAPIDDSKISRTSFHDPMDEHKRLVTMAGYAVRAQPASGNFSSMRADFGEWAEHAALHIHALSKCLNYDDFETNEPWCDRAGQHGDNASIARQGLIDAIDAWRFDPANAELVLDGGDLLLPGARHRV